MRHRGHIHASLVIALIALIALVASAQRAWGAEAVVPTGIEAWYNVTPQPSPAALPTVNPYPEETLHVGIAAGSEQARTYLTLDIGSIPSVNEITGGTLTLPVDPEDGSIEPETARIKACFAPDPGREVRGDFSPVPPIDCTFSSPAAFVAEPSPHFIVDLTPFTSTRGPFGSGLRSGGLALLPAVDAVAGRATWHVAFYAKGNQTARAQKISALVFHNPPLTQPGTEEVEVEFHEETLAFFETAAPPVGPVETEKPTVASAVAPVFKEESSYAYLSWVLMLPLLLPAFVIYFGGALTRDEDLAEELSS